MVDNKDIDNQETLHYDPGMANEAVVIANQDPKGFAMVSNYLFKQSYMLPC